MLYDRYGNPVESTSFLDTIGAGLYWLALVVVAILLICWVSSFFVVTHGASAKIVEFLGKPNRRARQPGLSLKAPWPLGTVVNTINLQLQEFAVEEEVRIISGGNDGLVVLPVKVQYHVVDDDNGEGPVTAHYKMKNPEQQMKSYVSLSVKASANGHDLMDLFGDRDAIESKVLMDLQEKFGQFGYKIENVLCDAPRLPDNMKAAFNRVLQADYLKKAATAEAEAERIKLVGIASAEKESKKLQGEGMADMRIAIAHGIEDSVKKLTASGISNEQALALLMDTNRLDTINSAAAHGNMILVDVKSQSDGFVTTLAAVKAAQGGGEPNNVTSMTAGKSAA